MGSTSKMPTLHADRIYAHSAPDRTHRRDKIDDDAGRAMPPRPSPNRGSFGRKPRRPPRPTP